MPISKIDTIISLIKRMSKPEKRHFKLYSGRLSGSTDTIYIQIFDLLENSNLKDDKKIIKKLGLKNSTQLVNAKRHLYSQLLRSLRLLYSAKHSQIGINEEIDYAIILAHKELYQESYEYLERIDIPTNELYSQNLLTITELKRKFGSHLDIVNVNYVNVIDRARSQLRIDWIIDDLYNELIKDHALLGFTRNERENTLRYERFYTKIKSIEDKPLNSLQKFKYFELNILFYKNKLNYKSIYKFAGHQFNLLNVLPYHKNEEHYMSLAVRCLNILLTVCYFNKNKEKYNYWFDQLNKKLIGINKGKGKHSIKHIDTTERLLIFHSILNNIYSVNIDINYNINAYDDFHHLLLKARYLAYQGNYTDALEIINAMLNLNELATEITLYARLYQILFHYRLNNFELVGNLLPSLRLAFKINGFFNKTINIILTTLAKGVKALNFGMRDEIVEMQAKLKFYSKTPYENLPFLYFDFYSWFESIKQDVHMSELN